MFQLFDRLRLVTKITLSPALALLCVAALTTAAEEDEFVVVVNAKNPVESMNGDEISRLFLKKLRRWPGWDRQEVVPVDQDAESAVRQAFSLEIHGRKASQIARFWQRQLFAGRDSPPEIFGSDAQVLSFVRGNPGAVGYVSPDAELGEGVRKLAIDSKVE